MKKKWMTKLIVALTFTVLLALGPACASLIAEGQTETGQTRNAVSFPTDFTATWKRDNYDNTLTFTTNILKASNQNISWILSGVSGDTYKIYEDDDPSWTSTVTIKLVNGNLAISGDSGSGQDNWNGTWKKYEIFTSVDALKAFLDSQPDNSPDTPIKVVVRVTDQTIINLANLIKTSGKYVSLDFNFSNFAPNKMYIPPNAFRDCTYLTGLIVFGGFNLSTGTIPGIGSGAFVNCPNLTSISLDTVGWDTNAFDGTFETTKLTNTKTGEKIESITGTKFTREPGGKTWRTIK